jgi:hypothetical protein
MPAIAFDSFSGYNRHVLSLKIFQFNKEVLMALKQIQVYVMLSITLLVSDSLLTENAQARVQALSFIIKGTKTLTEVIN